jgi:predicted branched-subunit amino acid permease
LKPEAFQSRQDAFRAGLRQAMGAPMLVLFAGMIGFGAMANTLGFSVGLAVLTSLLVFALPGQVVMLEMLSTGASALAVGLAVTLTSSRFLTMVVTLFPQLDTADRNRGLYARVQLLAMTAWAVSMREFPNMPPRYRLSYFTGLGLPCWLIAVPGTALGYVLAGPVPLAVTLALVFINPLFFLLTFTDVRPWLYRGAILGGGLVCPLFFQWDRDSSLLASGLVAGTLAYAIDRLWRHRTRRLA